MKTNGLGELNFAELNDDDLMALKKAEEVINKHSGKKVFLMAMCKD